MISWLSIGSVILICFVAIVGWVFDKPNLARYSSQFPFFGVDTILLMCLSTLSLAMLKVASYYKGHSKSLVVLAFAVVSLVLILLLSLLHLYAHSKSGEKLQFLLSYVSLSSGFLSYRSALSFVCIALSLLLSISKRRLFIQLSFFLVSFVLALSFIAITGYVIGAKSYYSSLVSVGLSIPAALCFALLSFTIILRLIKLASVDIFYSEDTSGKIVRLIFPLAFFVPLFLSWLLWLGYRSHFYDSVTAVGLLMLLPCSALSFVILKVSQRLFHNESRLIEVEKRKNEMQAELRKNEKINQDLEETNRLKDEFLITFSHELRTPLNAILGFSEILGDLDKDSTTFKSALDSIQRNAQKEVDLITDILDLSSMATGHFKLDVTRFDILEIMESVLQSIQFSAQSKNIEIRSNFPASLPMIYGDAIRIRQMVWNLISNAIKFTDTNGVISISISNVQSNIEIKVKDNGRGIDSEKLTKIFTAFWQEDGSMTRKHGGLGLGLSIVKSIVDAHGGEIQVRSEGRDKGAEFIVHIPNVDLKEGFEH